VHASTLRAAALALSGGLTGACFSGRPPWLGLDYALVTGGPVYVEAGTPPVEALLIEDGLVLAVGTRAELEARAASIEQKAKDWSIELAVRHIDLAGGTAVPGLQDAHGHLEGLGEALENVDLVGCPTFDELVRRVAERARSQPPGTWVLGRGWDQTLWPGGEFPAHAALSAAVPDHPVFLERVDGHAALVNARALALSGLDSGTLPSVEGGRIVVDERGAATGVLVDAATALVGARIPPPDRATRERRILAAQSALLAAGLTAIHDMGTAPETLSVLDELAQDGRLELRVLSYLWANEGPPQGFSGLRRADKDEDSKLRVVGAKLMVDGALGSRGAALLEPYTDAPDEIGLLQMSPETYAQRLRAVLELGLQPATHAIGDRANRMVLDAYEHELAREPELARLRPRIEHAQVVAPADWPRFAALGVIPSMQPTHATSDMRWAEARLGPERVQGAYAWKHLAGAKAPLAFGSDFPVESVNPLLGLYAARTRSDASGHPQGGWMPDERLDGAAALAGFTRGAAYAAREERHRGRLRPGYAADLTALDVDPVTCAPEALLGARVLYTIVDGRVHEPATP